MERELELPQAQAFAPVQAAQDPHVTLEPVRPHPAMMEHPRTMMEPDVAPAPVAHEPVPAPYVPPAPVRPSLSQPPRMPSIEEFPAAVREEFRQKVQGDQPQHDVKGAFGFLKRVVSSGLGLREEDHSAQPARPAAAAPQAPRPAAQARVPCSVRLRRKCRCSVLRHRRCRSGLLLTTQSARPTRSAAPQASLIRMAVQCRRRGVAEDDNLEIPAFLRRQPN